MRGDADGGPIRNDTNDTNGTGETARGYEGGALSFQVLGPVRAWCDGRPLKLGSPQQRATLAALLLRDGHPVPASELVDALWG
ncbi:hypothetical protein ABZ366_30970, partial [Streptomyces sp. NPDC005904]